MVLTRVSWYCMTLCYTVLLNPVLPSPGPRPHSALHMVLDGHIITLCCSLHSHCSAAYPLSTAFEAYSMESCTFVHFFQSLVGAYPGLAPRGGGGGSGGCSSRM